MPRNRLLKPCTDIIASHTANMETLMTLRKPTKAALVLLCALVSANLILPAEAADWPTYRHDIGRRAFTTEPLKTPLQPQWTYAPAALPSPAWPDPVREHHMMEFDYAYQTAVAGGVVYFGSSTDHQIHALDLATGRERWSFFTDAPVRFAPAVTDGKVFAVSDDGYAYCLSARDGKLIWRKRAAGADERIMGNEQMISRWPLRSGLVVSDGKVYLTAGIWPLEGVWAVAMKAADGSVLWNQKQPGNFAPQGYLSANAQVLLTPMGRAANWLIDRNTGAARAGKGHSWAIVKDNLFLAGSGPFKGNENLPVKGAWVLRPRPTSVLTGDLGAQPRRRKGPRTPVLGGKRCAAVSADTCYAAGSGKVTAFALDNWAKKWEVDCGRAFEVAAAGSAVIVGGDKVVTVFNAANGKKLWSAAVPGEARGLAVADGRLIVSTDYGRIVCFGPGKAAATKQSPTKPPKLNADAAGLAKQILKDTNVNDGPALLLGVGDGRLAMALAKQSRLRIYCAEPDQKKVAAARKSFNAAGLYGSRLVVHHIPDKKLPYPAYFADLVVAAKGAPKVAPAELYRVLRPCGGTAYVLDGAAQIKGDALKRDRLGGAERLVRGPLAGAGEWTHQYADAGKSASSGDTLVRWPLKVLWFGKPGPGRMMQRHLRGTAPLFADGRMFILGQHSIIAVDAYNGREIWFRRLPAIQRRVVDIRGGNMATDGENLYLVTGNTCLTLDAATGKFRRLYRLPVPRPQYTLGPKRTFALGELGRVEISRTADALEIKLDTKDTRVTNAVRETRPTGGDSWELFFDFRPAAKRTGLYGRGAFHVVVVPATVESPKPASFGGAWAPLPEMKVAGKMTPTGSTTTVRIAWREIAKLAGAKPADFTFGVILNSSNDGKSRTARTYKFADNTSYSLANCWGTMILGPRHTTAAPAGKVISPDKPIEQLTWGHLAVVGDVIVGTIVERRDSGEALRFGWDFSSEGHDYTGPHVPKVLSTIGVGQGVKTVFALDGKTGALKWVYSADKVVPHNALAVRDGCVYLMDRDDPWVVDGRKARESVGESKLVCLDLATGKQRWQVSTGPSAHHQLRLGQGVLLTAGMSGMTAYDAKTGAKRWSVTTRQPMHHCSAYIRAPVITSKWVYDEPRVYDVRTGKMRMVGAGDAAKPWTWGNFRGCGTVSGAENMLFFRAGPPTLLDTGDTKVRRDFVGIRPGCFINIIPAGGLVLMPEASSGCGCAYNFQTTVVLMPAPAAE